MIRLVLLVLGSLASWALLAGPAALALDGEVLLPSAAALLLCLVPAAATLAGSLALRGQPPLALVLGGTAVRLLGVPLLALLLCSIAPYFQRPAFWAWLVVFYLLTLGWETALLASWRAANEPVRKGVRPLA